ncbi:Imm41 family immunity protein [Herbaspirillum huttiense]|uniref:Imm41 family immunity protein n=2 Tax=Herbaspirillum huttiense TaxID=863372 RepID=A0AAJ2LXM5_9BURK|nr:Imm41 family immunity protein [Herbaspirillum huttiense]MDR9838608.1 Imm41 family immunity protein [Herbaspirillum huttiense]
MNPLSIILENFPHCEEFSEQSFMNILYEERRIDLDAYWKLEWALIQLTSAEEDYPHDQYWPVFQIFSHLSSMFCAHANKYDLYDIRNFDDWFINDLMARTRIVFEGYFMGRAPDITCLQDYVNPLLESETSSATEIALRNCSGQVSGEEDDESELADEQGRMDMESQTRCLEIIYKNVSYGMQWSAQSFLGMLHDQQRLDMDAYWQLECAILQLSRDQLNEPGSHGWTVHQIFSAACNRLHAHLDPDDSVQIRDVSKERIRTLLQRMNVVFDGFFKGKAPDMDAAFEEKNPLMHDERGTRDAPR